MRILLQKLSFRLKELIYKNIEGKKVFILFIVTNVVYGFMLLVSIPRVLGFSGGMKIFDMMPMGYDPAYAALLLEKLGAQGREAYLYNQIPVDFVYPFLFGITYCLILVYFINRLNGLKAQYFYLCLLPLMAGLFDYLENFGIINMLVSYPDVSELSVQLTNFFTVLKSLLSTITFTVLIILLVMFSLHKTIRKKS